MPTIKAEIAGKVVTLLGYDGADFYNVLVDAAGRLQIDVVGSGLPAGAATEAKQDDGIAELVLLQELRGALLSIDVDRLEVDVRSSTLPTDAATEATLATLATDAKLELCRLLLASLDGVDFATGVDIATVVTELALKANLNETQPVSAAALPLPAGAATSAKQDTLAGKIDGSGDLIYQAENAYATSGAANVPDDT